MAGKLNDIDVVRRNIEFARVRRGMSRDELAKIADVGYKNLANFLSGSQNIIDEKIGRIAIALNVAYDDLFDVGFEHRFKAGLATSKTEPAQTRGAMVLHERSGHIQEFSSITDGASDETIDDILAYARWRVGRAGARKASAGEVSYTTPKRG